MYRNLFSIFFFFKKKNLDKVLDKFHWNKFFSQVRREQRFKVIYKIFALRLIENFLDTLGIKNIRTVLVLVRLMLLTLSEFQTATEWMPVFIKYIELIYLSVE